MIFKDHIGHQINLPALPQRIISLVPSQTELLFDLGLGDRVVGVTKFCIHPKDQVAQKTKIGGTKNFNFEAIHELRPDLIIGNKEENYKEGIVALQQHYPVWMSDIYTLEDALQMMQQLGELTGTGAEAHVLMQVTSTRFKKLQPIQIPLSAAYFIWRKPYMAVGHNNIIDHILQRCGFHNAFAHLSRYPEISTDQLQQADPQLILLSSEPYPFKEKHLREFQELCPQANIKIVDGEMFSWYGSRLLQAPGYLQRLINDLGGGKTK